MADSGAFSNASIRGIYALTSLAEGGRTPGASSATASDTTKIRFRVNRPLKPAVRIARGAAISVERARSCRALTLQIGNSSSHVAPRLPRSRRVPLIWALSAWTIFNPML
jgi:hypothetical protein